MLRRTTRFLCAAIGFAGLSSNGHSQEISAPTAANDARIAAIKELKIDDATITQVVHDSSPVLAVGKGGEIKNLPPRMVVKMELHPAKGSRSLVEIWLPDAENWNDRFLALGNGGAAGHIKLESLAPFLARGYAVATTDMGTSPNANSGVRNPEVWKDFGFRSTHLMTVAAKQVIEVFYKKAAKYSYFNGRSTGGQQALQEAQRYPEDYDGIIAVNPAHCRTPLHAYFLWNDQILKACPFTESQEKNIVAAGNEIMAHREIPAIAGKFISDPRCTNEEVEAVIALALKKDPTLTSKHADALRKLYDGPKHEVTGERIFNGIPLGIPFGASHGHLYLFRWAFGADINTDEINFGTDIDTYTAKLGPYLNADNPNLDAFQKRGGKLLMTSGSADPIVPYHATLDYYERVVAHFGDLEKVRSFFRFYFIPGMAHGRGGPGLNNPPELLDPLIRWRETGVAPEGITTTRTVNKELELEIPIYPYPDKTGWDAENSTFKPVPGPRKGVEPVADRFLPEAAQ